MHNTQQQHGNEDALAASMLQEIQAEKAIAGNRFLNLLRTAAVWLHEKLNGINNKKKTRISIQDGDMDLLEDIEKETCKNIKTERGKINDNFAREYAARYRGSYLLNYNTIVLAVLLAVSSLALLYIDKLYKELYNDETVTHAIHIVLLIFGILKVLCLLVIFTNTQEAKKLEFNRKAIEYRYLSEQLRCMYYMQLLGSRKAPTPSSGRLLHGASIIQNDLDKVINTLLATKSRQQGEEPLVIVYDKQHLLNILHFVRGSANNKLIHGWIKPQIHYHQNNAAKNKKLNEKLEHRIAFLNLIILIAVIIDVIAGSMYLSHLFYNYSKFFHTYITVFVLIGATIVPAYVASRNGLLFQSEARKQEIRSTMMLQLLQELDKRYEALIARISQNTNTGHAGSYTQEAIELVNETAQIMIDEVAEWAFLSNKDVPEP